MPAVSEAKIRELCSRVVALRESEEFESAVQELRSAIHEHLSGIRDKVADLAFMVAAIDSNTVE